MVNEVDLILILTFGKYEVLSISIQLQGKSNWYHK
jgi:hypothetical protein